MNHLVLKQVKQKKQYMKRIEIHSQVTLKKDEETSHEYEENSIENIEYHFETHSTLEMKQRASTDGCLNYEGVPNDG